MLKLQNSGTNIEIAEQFKRYLLKEEKSAATVEKYFRDVRAFLHYAAGKRITKELTVAYKEYLIKEGYRMRSVNSMLASVNSLLVFLGFQECRVKMIKIQRQIYCADEKELTREEYLRLLEESKKNKRLLLLLQTICSTGIRVSELSHFTAEAVRAGEAIIFCKGKMRRILIPERLCKRLLCYAKEKGIEEGAIFCTAGGEPINRSNIWRMMKSLGKRAGVEESKVSPRALRKLFARTFYEAEKDAVKLADILGHSSVDTTRIYLMQTGEEHRRMLEKLNLLI